MWGKQDDHPAVAGRRKKRRAIGLGGRSNKPGVFGRKECLESGSNYGEIAKKYGVSYQQVRSWTLKYKAQGESGLEDRRGQRKYAQEPRTELEEAQVEIAQLKHQLQIAQWENRLLRQHRINAKIRIIRDYPKVCVNLLSGVE